MLFLKHIIMRKKYYLIFGYFSFIKLIISLLIVVLKTKLFGPFVLNGSDFVLNGTAFRKTYYSKIELNMAKGIMSGSQKYVYYFSDRKLSSVKDFIFIAFT